MPRSARSVVLANFITMASVIGTQIVVPNRLYNGKISGWLSQNLGLNRAVLTPATEPAHGVVVCLNVAVLVHVFSAAMSSRPHAHAGIALMEFVYGGMGIATCLLYPNTYGSGVLLFAALPNLAFATAICVVGGHGWRDMLNLLMGDAAVSSVDVKSRKKKD